MRSASRITGGGMVRCGFRATERRRGSMALISAVAAALPACRDARTLRRRFESALCDVLQARDVELRDGPPLMCPRPDAISVEVRTGDVTLGAIDATFDGSPRLFDAWDRQ